MWFLIFSIWRLLFAILQGSIFGCHSLRQFPTPQSDFNRFSKLNQTGNSKFPMIMKSSTGIDARRNRLFPKKPTYTLQNDSFHNSEMARQFKETKLLSPEEEKALGYMVQDLAKMTRHRKNLADKLQREPTIEECASDLGITAELYTHLIRSGREAKQRLVTQNLRLVVVMAASFSGNGIAMEDLVQDGIFGLTRAAEKFDPSLGFRFSTYAICRMPLTCNEIVFVLVRNMKNHYLTRWIRQRLTTSSRRQRLIKIPGSNHVRYNSLRQAVKILAVEHGRRPTEDEIAAHMGITAEQVTDITLSMHPMISLDQDLYFTSSSSYSDTGGIKNLSESKLLSDDSLCQCCTEESSVVEIGLDWALMRDDLEVNLSSTLSKVQRDIIRMKVGLDNGRAKSTAEVSEKLNIPPYTILREEKIALNKLRVSPGSFRLKNYGDMLTSCV